MKNNFLNNNNIIYGIHPVNELIKSNKRKIFKIYIQSPTSQNILNILKNINKQKIEVIYCSKEKLGSICRNDDHQGIIAIAEEIRYSKKMFDPSKYSAILLLDKIQDPRNLGAIIRSANCFNIFAMIISERGGVHITPTVIKASSGLSEYMDIYIASSENGIKEAKNNGYNIYLTGFNGTSINNFEPKLPFCIVIGNEEVGISKNLYKYGETISIPQRNNNISLNASVAASIIMHNLTIKTGLCQ